MEAKLLDLNAYGVEEMSNAEMRKTEGGWVLFAVVGVAVILYHLLNPRPCYDT